MTGVRNGVLGREITTAVGFTVLGQVPAGMTWLLKTVHAYNASSQSAQVIIQLQSAVGGISARLPTFTLVSGTADTWEGWTALMPGDQLLVFADQASIHVWAAGAELPGDIPPRARVLPSSRAR